MTPYCESAPRASSKDEEAAAAVTFRREDGVGVPGSSVFVMKKSGGGDDDDDDLIGWDGDQDLECPYNWPMWKISANVGAIAFMVFIVLLSGSVIAPGVPTIAEEFHSSDRTAATLIVSIFVIGLAFGGVLFAPLSEIYGRLVIYHIANVGFLALTIACALAPSLPSLLAFRFLAGVFGSTLSSNGGGSIADMIRPERRALVLAFFGVGQVFGPFIGPVIGAFVAEAKGWRWIFWIVLILGGFAVTVMFLFGRETYAPIILQRKVDRLKKETGNPNLRHALPGTRKTRWEFVRHNIVRPSKLLVLSPIVTCCAIFLALNYAYVILLFTTVGEVFEEQYGIRGKLSGLAFLGLGIGSLFGVVVNTVFSDRAVRKVQASGGEMKPEVRLRLTPIGASLLPVGFFIYGWSAEYNVHWIVPVIGMAVIGMGNLMMNLTIPLYLIDTFNIYAASALACAMAIGQIGGGLLPLAGVKLFDALGVGWGSSLLGFIAAAMVPVTVVFLKYGEWLRKRFEVKNL